MPEFRDKEVSIAFDLCGCPNRCRHCWLGRSSRSSIDLSEAIQSFSEAREWVRGGKELPHLSRVRYFGGHVREPHYCPDYRALREKELELNGGVDYAADYQLLSVWRLARDPRYGKWAREIGTRKCQVTLFGVGAVNDWFYRRRGAHEDIVTATLRLVENGIQPRWQVFLNRKGLPDFPEILRLADRLRLRERLESMGLRFQLFLNDWTPTGEARRHQCLRIRLEDVKQIPREMILATEQYTNKPFRCTSEMQWISGMLRGEDGPIGMEEPRETWFYVTPDGSVFPNTGSLESWWRLGDFRRDGFRGAFSAFQRGAAPALKASAALTIHRAARTYGDPQSDRVYLCGSDLRQLWLELHCGTDGQP
jgi:hypothetical protein